MRWIIPDLTILFTHLPSPPFPHPSLQNVSNSPFQEEELDRYQRHCERSERRALSKQDVSEAKAKIAAATK